MGKTETGSKCYWVTGLSSAGKTTISKLLVDNLRSRGEKVILLDGDELREIFSNNIYTPEDRLKTALKYSKLCSIIVKQNVNIVISVIGLFKEVHQWNRRYIPGYIEIFIDVPMEELLKRDPKKIYDKALKGELKNVYGVDLKADFPKHPDIHLVWTQNKSIKNMIDDLLNQI